MPAGIVAQGNVLCKLLVGIVSLLESSLGSWLPTAAWVHKGMVAVPQAEVAGGFTAGSCALTALDNSLPLLAPSSGQQ